MFPEDTLNSTTVMCVTDDRRMLAVGLVLPSADCLTGEQSL